MFLKKNIIISVTIFIFFLFACGALINCGTSGGMRYDPAGPDGSGSGTRRDPFIVASEATLRQVGTGVDGWNLDACYRQITDIEMIEGNWVRIGSMDTDSFTGVYDGGSFTIFNFNYNAEVIISGNKHDMGGYGMFGSVAATGAVMNLTINGNITVNIRPETEESIGNVIGVGGVVGWLDGGTIENINFNGSVRVGDGRTWTDPFGNALTTNYYGHRTSNTVGGVVGGVTSAHSRVVNCHVKAIVIGYFQVGGVIGSLENIQRDANPSVISNLSFTPPEIGIDNTAFVITGTNRVGMVIGNMGDFTTARNLSTTGEVKLHIKAISYPNHAARNIAEQAGGLIGRSLMTYIP